LIYEQHPHNNQRVLVIDDNPAIHEDFRKILIKSSNLADHEILRGIWRTFPTRDALLEIDDAQIHAGPSTNR
jgi:hypothetical protein